MSFDVFMQRFDDQRVDVDALLEAVKALGVSEDPDGFKMVSLDGGDGGGAEISLKDDGAAFFIRGLTPVVAQAMFDVMRIGGFVALPAMENPKAILIDADQQATLPGEVLDHFETVVARSADDILRALNEGHAQWSDYRDGIAAG